MKAWKFMLLAGGLVGLIGFFLPFFKWTHGDSGVSISAFNALKGVGDAREILSEEIAKMPEPQVQKAIADFNDIVKKAGSFVLIFYIPTALMFLVGLVNTIRRKMGRLAGLLGFISGVAAILCWVLWQQALSSDEAKQVGDATSAAATMATGLHLILISGVIGAIGGLGALVKPDRNVATMSRVA